MKTVTCLNCGWVHMEVTRASAECGVRGFNEAYDRMPFDYKESYLPFKEQRKPHEERDYNLGYSKIESYEHCQSCNGNYKNFRDAKAGDCPDGCTIGPILRRED